MIKQFKCVVLASFMFASPMLSYAANAVFHAELQQGTTRFPSNNGLYDRQKEYNFIIRNLGQVDMPGMSYFYPSTFVKHTANTTCGSTLRANESCQLALKFVANQLGSFTGQLKVCGGYGNWCSVFPNALNVSVTQNTIVSNNCTDIKSRPFADQTCRGSEQYSDNFGNFLKQVLNQAVTHREFNYFQHRPSVDETTVPCLEARQEGVGLDPLIEGGGVPLCQLMGYVSNNASVDDQPSNLPLSKQFPPYLTRLLGTPYPITSSTVPLSQLGALMNDFDTPAMDGSVQDVGYAGHVNFLNDYYEQQLSVRYDVCGIISCPSIFYLPYKLNAGQAQLETWPPLTNYWGTSAGGGSGAGYQIQAFKPGTATHYTLFSGGGGGGGGNTTPEISNAITSLINTGSGGGGGSQFADCYVNNLKENLNGLGLGAGTGSGVSTPENTPVIFQPPRSVDYTFLAPALHPTWNEQTILSEYARNMTYLFDILIPKLYNDGYSITMTGGGGGGTGLEFLDAAGQEFTPHVVSIGYGFNFCYVFNKNNQYHASDCIPSPVTSTPNATVEDVTYQNIGPLFHQGMELAILPENCNGYTDYTCTCLFQHTYVVEQLTAILISYGFTAADIPHWLVEPHCTSNTNQVVAQAGSSTCVPPWVSS